jgi:hypothetical protein
MRIAVDAVGRPDHSAAAVPPASDLGAMSAKNISLAA